MYPMFYGLPYLDGVDGCGDIVHPQHLRPAGDPGQRAGNAAPQALRGRTAGNVADHRLAGQRHQPGIGIEAQLPQIL